MSIFLCLIYFTYKYSGGISFFLMTGMIFRCAYLHPASSHLQPGEMSILSRLPKIRRGEKDLLRGNKLP